MKPTRLSPIDILGLTLGVIAIILVVGGFAYVVTHRTYGPAWTGSDGWRGTRGDFSFGAQREEKDEPVSGDFTELEVRNIAGSIDISGTSASQMTVHWVKTAMSPRGMEAVTVDVQRRGSRLVLEEKHAPMMFGGGTVSFRIAVPSGMKLIEAHSVSGSVTVRDLPSVVDQNLSTVSGSVTTSQAANLDASTTSGHLQFTFAGKALNARSVSGSIDGSIDSLAQGGSASVHTVSGSVSLNAFAGLDASLNLRSLSGSVSCGFPVTVAQQARNRLQGTVGSGAANLEVGTTSGSISLSKD